MDNKEDRPWLWKKGQSGNPKGRPVGTTMSMKEYAKKRLAEMTEEEREDFLEGIGKKEVWAMAEGNPETKSEVKIAPDNTFTEEEIKAAKELIATRLNKTSDRPIEQS